MKGVIWAGETERIKEVLNAPTNSPPPITIKLGGIGPADYEIATWNLANTRNVMALNVKKFKDLVEEENLTPNQAAEEVGMDLRTIKKTAENFGIEVQELLDSHGWMSPEVKKQWTRATQVKILDMALEAVKADPKNSKLLKVALEASRAIANDNQIGIYTTKPVALPPNQMLALPPGLAALVSAVEVDPAHEQEKE